MLFAWDDFNVEHISRHDVKPREAEFVVEYADAPWPEQKGEDKLLVWGPTETGRLLQVIFVLKSPEDIEFDALTINEWADLNEGDRIIYVVHAMNLTPIMKRRYRKRRRQS
jgi:uncharacterized DUF497 family protein